MNWLKGMNTVVRYVEKNLTQPIEYELMARMVGCSSYEFSRIFSFMTGMSISEYVRRRRLSCAVFDIQHGTEKMIDIGLKYGYDSPAAFSRAFKELHGVAPSAARKTGVPLKSYSAIKFILSIKGVEEMNFTIVEKPAFDVIGIRHIFKSHYDNDDLAEGQIKALWEATPDAMVQQLLSVTKSSSKGLFGMFTRSYLGQNEYLIAVESDAALPPDWPQNDAPVTHTNSGPFAPVFVKHSVPPSKWVVIENPNNDPNLSERVYSEWLPDSGYRRAQMSVPTMEFYANPKENTYDNLWIPVDSKADIARKFETAKAALAALEATMHNTPIDIDLTTMIPDPHALQEGLEITYTPDGKMVAYAPTSGNGLVGTAQSFTAPIKIAMRAKTDSTNLRLYYGRSPSNYWGAWVHLNGAGNDGELYDGDDLFTNDLAIENQHYHENASPIPINEFIDVEWILGETVMAIKINGQVRVASQEYEYMEAFKNGFTVTSPVYPAPGRGSTITVARLQVTQL